MSDKFRRKTDKHLIATSSFPWNSNFALNPDQKEFLNLRTLPARMDAKEVGLYLGFLLHEVSVLISAKLLKPLGNPSPNSRKYFATVTIQKLREDEKWLNRATDTIARRWRARNANRQNGNSAIEVVST